MTNEHDSNQSTVWMFVFMVMESYPPVVVSKYWNCSYLRHFGWLKQGIHIFAVFYFSHILEPWNQPMMVFGQGFKESTELSLKSMKEESAAAGDEDKTHDKLLSLCPINLTL